MADLMTETYTYDSLAQRYGNFCVPLIKIKVAGKDVVSTSRISVVDFRAVLSLDAASTVVVKLDGLYREDRHEFDSEVKGYFVLGSIVEIEIGYLSSSRNIFKGFVAMLGMEFIKAPLLVVTLMDVRRLMMSSGSKYMLHEVKNYSDAFRTIMGKYSKLCTVEIDATEDNLEKPVSQTQNDYLFVKEQLIKSGRVDREFFVLGNKAYFRKPRKVSQPIITLEYGRGLLAFKSDEEYRDVDIVVIGYDSNAQTAIEGTASVGKNKNQKSLLGETPVYTVTDPWIDTQKRADEKAQSIADRKKWGTKGGQGITIGLPELVPGRFICVKSLEKECESRHYYLKNVVHEINGEHFQTFFEIGGWT